MNIVKKVIKVKVKAPKVKRVKITRELSNFLKQIKDLKTRKITGMDAAKRVSDFEVPALWDIATDLNKKGLITDKQLGRMQMELSNIGINAQKNISAEREKLERDLEAAFERQKQAQQKAKEAQRQRTIEEGQKELKEVKQKILEEIRKEALEEHKNKSSKFIQIDTSKIKTKKEKEEYISNGIELLDELAGYVKRGQIPVNEAREFSDNFRKNLQHLKKEGK